MMNKGTAMTDTVIHHCGWTIRVLSGLWVATVPGDGYRVYPTLADAKSAAERESKLVALAVLAD